MCDNCWCAVNVLERSTSTDNSTSKEIEKCPSKCRCPVEGATEVVTVTATAETMTRANQTKGTIDLAAGKSIVSFAKVVGANEQSKMHRCSKSGAMCFSIECILKKACRQKKGLRSQRQCNGQNATAVQAKRFRTVFTMPQLTVLEAVFQKKQYMVGEERCRLAKCLGLSDTQIKVWFQNRRIKWRKEERESGLALLNNYSGVHYVRL